MNEENSGVATEKVGRRGTKLVMVFVALSVVVGGLGGWFYWTNFAEKSGFGEEGDRVLIGEIGETLTYEISGKRKIDLKYVPGGTFTMGSPPSEEGRDEDYEDQVEVTLSSHFWIAESEVTQEQWMALMMDNPCVKHGDNLPVARVSWDEAQNFVKKLNERGGLPDGWAWTLPTEAQWERACRGGTTTAFSTGDILTEQQAKFTGDWTVDVKSFAPNGYGLYDVHGNVWEWCLDTWRRERTGGNDPVVLADLGDCVVRGGGIEGDVSDCRSAGRDYMIRSLGMGNVGFRIALAPSIRGKEKL